jgi:hypothetical protein
VTANLIDYTTDSVSEIGVGVMFAKAVINFAILCDFQVCISIGCNMVEFAGNLGERHASLCYYVSNRDPFAQVVYRMDYL